jgi:hypothetical protein
MKPLWIQTLAWIAAIAVAVLFAFANPDGVPAEGSPVDLVPHGSGTPR